MSLKHAHPAGDPQWDLVSVTTSSPAFSTRSSVLIKPHTFPGLGKKLRWYTRYETLDIDIKHRHADGTATITATVHMDSKSKATTIEDREKNTCYVIRNGEVENGSVKVKISRCPMIQLMDADIMLDDHDGFIISAHRHAADPCSIGETIMAMMGDAVKPGKIFAKNLDMNIKISA